MIRKPNWELRLADEIGAAQARRWEWGAHDCATFAWRCLRVMADGGATPVDTLMGGWSDRAAAEAAVAAAGGIAAALDARFQRIAMAQARRGDLATVQGGEGVAVAVVEGGGLWGPGLVGLRRAALSDGMIFWSVD